MEVVELLIKYSCYYFRDCRSINSLILLSMELQKCTGIAARLRLKAAATRELVVGMHPFDFQSSHICPIMMLDQ